METTAETVLIQNRFLIAKYVPDPVRMEPRNCGVILWNHGTVKARFLGHGADAPRGWRRQLGMRPDATYPDWLEYWNEMINRSSLVDKSGQVIERSSPKFLDVLRANSSGNYLLVDGGAVVDRLPQKETPAALDQLFRELVWSGAEHQREGVVAGKARILNQSTKEVLRRSGIEAHPSFYRNFDWICPIDDTKQHFHFDFAIHEGTPKAVMQRVMLERQNTVNNAAFMFQAMQRISRKPIQCAAFVHATEDDLSDDAVYAAYQLLSRIGRVVNTAATNEAVHDLLQVAI